mgnify:CR=1 FL=1
MKISFFKVERSAYMIPKKNRPFGGGFLRPCSCQAVFRHASAGKALPLSIEVGLLAYADMAIGP